MNASNILFGLTFIAICVAFLASLFTDRRNSTRND